MWQQLVIHLALISSLVLCLDFVLDQGERLGARTRPLVIGLLMGCVGLLSMALAEPLLPGFVFDMRAPMVACAGLFGGPTGGIVAAAIAGGMRIHIGGAGMVAGLATVGIALATGLIFHSLMRRRALDPRSILVFAAAVGATYLLAYLVLPPETAARIFAKTAAPAVTLNTAASAIVAILLWRGERQRAVARSDMIYRQMVCALPDCLNVKDLSHRYIAANPATAAALGAPDETALIGRKDDDFFPPERAAAFAADEAGVLATGRASRTEQLLRSDAKGELWVSSLRAPLYGQGGQVIGLITHLRDISETRHISRLKREFVSTVSHELRTPLTSIRGALGLLSSGALAHAPDETARVLAIAQSNGDRLVRLVNDILDMETLDSGKMSFELGVHEIGAIAARAVEGARVFLPEKQIEIRLDDRSCGARARTDEGRLGQVIDNLLSNAIKFSPERSKVDVLIAPPSRGMLRISVIDQGPGIDPGFRSSAFVPFAQADGTDSRREGGTGLGLSICRMIVERLGGRIDFEPAAGGGTAFHVDVACLAPASRCRAEAAVPVAAQ